ARGLQDRRAGAGGEVACGVGGEIAGAVVVDEGPVVLESGDRGLGGQLEVQAVGVRAPEGPYRALEVPVVTADVGAHGDRVAVVHVARDLAPPFGPLGVGLRSTVGQADSVEDLAVVIEQRGGAGER